MVKKWSIRILVFLLLSLYILIILANGINFGVPSRDSGAFLYGGREVAKGLVPYLDFWDHKPPLIFGINALASAIDTKLLWGLWLIEELSIGLFVLVSYIWGKAISNYRAILAVMALAVTIIPGLMEGGNRVEEYGMVLQTAALAIMIMLWQKKYKHENWGIFVVGMIGGLLFLLKPNLIGLPAALAVFYIYKRKSLAKILILGLGCGLVNLFVIYYFWNKGGLTEMIDQVFRFNLLYAGSSVGTKLSALWFGIKNTWPLVIMSLIGIWGILKKKIRQTSWYKFGIIWLSVEVIASAFSGREYRQYFLPSVLPLMLMSLAGMEYISKQNILIRRAGWSVLLVIVLMSVMPMIKKSYEMRPVTAGLEYRGFLFNNFDEHKETLDFILKNSNKNDKILIWGSEPAMLYLSQRESVDKYYYQFRLFFPGYDQENRKKMELVDNIIKNPPKIIIDASSSTYDRYVSDKAVSMPPLDLINLTVWENKSDIETDGETKRLIEFIGSNYKYTKNTFDNKWAIYLYK